MNKIQNLIFSGIALSLSGIAMLLSDAIGVEIAKVLTPILFIVSGIFSSIFAKANPQDKRPYQYYMLKGVLYILFGLTIGFAAKSLGGFLNYATYFILFIGLFDVIFGFALVNSGLKFKWENLIFKFVAGFMGLIGSIMILGTSLTNQKSGLIITGIVIALMGLETIVFATRIKTDSTKL